MIDPRTPVFVGAGQFVGRDRTPLGPRRMMAIAAERAVADAGLTPALWREVDTIAVVGFAIDAPETGERLPAPRLADPPAALAQDMGAAPRRAVYTHMGGNTPQALANWAAQLIADGEAEIVCLVGAEYLGSLMKALAAGADLAPFGGGPEGEPERWGDDRADCTAQERAHGLSFPTNTYPLFENALRAHRGRTLDQHQRALGALMAPFTQIAAANPYAWFPKARTAEELITVAPENRMVGFPYPKYLNSIIQVDQAACVLVMAQAKADALGVAADKRIYLHGCADAHDLWNPLERVNYHSAPAIGAAARHALAMAGASVADMALFDLYSCFPVAVEMACQELGLAEDDPRGFTVTGGLPYFGGPGNNYVMHSIAEMMTRLRARPGAFGLVTGNGWHLTKQSIGVYGAAPVQGRWSRGDYKAPQREIEALKGPDIVAMPEGRAAIETYTVVHARDSYRMGIVIGRDAAGRRFVANTPSDPATLADLESREGVGRAGVVSAGPKGRNLFVPQ